MRGRALLAFFYGVLALLFTLLSIGVEQWTSTSSSSSVGLFGSVSNGVYYPFLGQDLSNSPRLYQYYVAGSTGAAFLIIGVVLLTVFTVVAFMKAFKESMPFPERKKNDPGLTSCFSRLGLWTAVLGASSVWFGWALWASLRVYGDGYSGWSILFVTLGFVFGFIGAIVFANEVSGESYLLIPDHHESNLHVDFTTPPYKTSLRSFLSYSQWDAPALSRTLFYLSLIVFTIYYLEYTTGFDVVSPKDLWVRIAVGILYWAVAAVISRICCEIVLAIFVAKDHFLGKNVQRPAREIHAAPVIPVMDDAAPAQAQAGGGGGGVGGGYQQV